MQDSEERIKSLSPASVPFDLRPWDWKALFLNAMKAGPIAGPPVRRQNFYYVDNPTIWNSFNLIVCYDSGMRKDGHDPTRQIKLIQVHANDATMPSLQMAWMMEKVPTSPTNNCLDILLTDPTSSAAACTPIGVFCGVTTVCAPCTGPVNHCAL